VEAARRHDVPVQLVPHGPVRSGDLRVGQAVDGVRDAVVVGAGDLDVLVADVELDGAAVVLDAQVRRGAGGRLRGDVADREPTVAVGVAVDLLQLGEDEEGAVGLVVTEVVGEVDLDADRAAVGLDDRPDVEAGDVAHGVVRAGGRRDEQREGGDAEQREEEQRGRAPRHAHRLARRLIARWASRLSCCSRSAWRLSYSFLPRARARSTLARPRMKYSSSGTTV